MGRLADIDDIAAIVEDTLKGVPEDTPPEERPLRGYKALVTSGPTIEDIDPVRFLSNRSSGRQGHAVAEALAALGADVTLVSGPVSQPDPARVTTHRVRSAQDMFRGVPEGGTKRTSMLPYALLLWQTGLFHVKHTKSRRIHAQVSLLYVCSRPPTSCRLSPKPGHIAHAW